ncbi:MobQ family relaxase [Kozakia baliensis]|uniref:MobQ family relaxase n=2 Tax=Acetobacteraceae TaxID=433 RepID=UPI00116DB811|nr:MobQ family relaxase [Kozakia baliensis]GEL65703.1 hypothetical protein KBA01_29890 [Kozakia baliensis]
MAIYHLSAKTFSRARAQSAVAAAAYRSGGVLYDVRTGTTHDYRRKAGIVAHFILTPEGAEWAQDRNLLWNEAESAEKRSNATIAREYELALPCELDQGTREEVAREFAAELVKRYGVAADVAIHAPGREGDNRNHHAHILTTTRTVTATSLGVKTRVLDSKQTGRAEIEHLRSVWASQVNAALERHQVEERVDHRSFARREIAKVATVHVGVHAAAIERKAKREAEAESRPYEPVTNRVRHNAKFMEGARLALKALRMKGKAALALLQGYGERQAAMRQTLEAERVRQAVARRTRAKDSDLSHLADATATRIKGHPDNVSSSWFDKAMEQTNARTKKREAEKAEAEARERAIDQAINGRPKTSGPSKGPGF